MVLLDTCSVIELCLSSPSFTRSCMEKIEKGAAVLSISFAEIALKMKLRKLTLNLSAEELYENYKGVSSVEIVKIGCEEWFEAIALPWSNKDPADRLIVAYAKKHGLPVVTTDKIIKKYYSPVIW